MIQLETRHFMLPVSLLSAPSGVEFQSILGMEAQMPLLTLLGRFQSCCPVGHDGQGGI